MYTTIQKVTTGSIKKPKTREQAKATKKSKRPIAKCKKLLHCKSHANNEHIVRTQAKMNHTGFATQSMAKDKETDKVPRTCKVNGGQVHTRDRTQLHATAAKINTRKPARMRSTTHKVDTSTTQATNTHKPLDFPMIHW